MEEDVFLPPQSFLVCVAAAAAPPLFSCFQQAIEEGEEGERKRRGVSFEVDKGKSCSTHRMRGGEREDSSEGAHGRRRERGGGKRKRKQERERDSPTSIPLSLSQWHTSIPPRTKQAAAGKKTEGGAVLQGGAAGGEAPSLAPIRIRVAAATVSLPVRGTESQVASRRFGFVFGGGGGGGGHRGAKILFLVDCRRC